MFANRYFGPRYFPDRYFGEGGASVVTGGGYFGIRYFAPAGTGSGSGGTYPDPADVRSGITYGPNGNDYTGTWVSGAGGAYTPRRGR